MRRNDIAGTLRNRELIASSEPGRHIEVYIA